jgi:hypothetical protein
MPTKYGLIKQAIQNKQQVFAMYHGYPMEMCPHVLGTKEGREQALFYQFGGDSSSGLGPDGSPGNWRCLFLDELSDVSVRPGAWHTAPNHSRPQTCVDVLDVQITKPPRKKRLFH